ncbi:MAG TPA: class I SAM-dependent methyltransferase [Patescibacteria group bacterium]|nr:class I SAM-dependent methyltransferase [Patescibacteria group bacterium]
MSAHYDNFDYPSYWESRIYEHKSEVFVLENFFKRLKIIGTIADIGAGYGRLIPTYIHRAKRIYLTDPSSKLLSIAKEKYKNKKIKFIHSKIENLETKIKPSSVDLVLFIRVLHHVKNLDNAFRIINRLLKNNGHLILEFPNKLHFKSALNELRHGNLTFLLDIFPKDIRSKKSINTGCIDFFNYHPDDVLNHLENNGFRIIDIKSVSNIRSVILKKLLPVEILLYLEKYLQRMFSKTRFGPSLFILASKK